MKRVWHAWGWYTLGCFVGTTRLSGFYAWATAAITMLLVLFVYRKDLR